MPIFVRSVIPLAGFLILAGCSPAQPPTAASTPTPTVPVCVPLDGATPFPCTQADFESLAEQRALYEEAEEVLRRYQAEVERQEVDWHLREMTSEFEATTTGDFTEFNRQLIELDRRDKAKRVTGPAPIVWVKPRPQDSKNGSIATLRACMDGTQADYVTETVTAPTPGAAFEYSFYFSREGHALKIVTSSFKKVVTC